PHRQWGGLRRRGRCVSSKLAPAIVPKDVERFPELQLKTKLEESEISMRTYTRVAASAHT
ncbi:hypothetical protein ACPZ19_51505, partial [Amycolatopsis lurida]